MEILAKKLSKNHENSCKSGFIFDSGIQYRLLKVHTIDSKKGVYFRIPRVL